MVRRENLEEALEDIRDTVTVQGEVCVARKDFLRHCAELRQGADEDLHGACRNCRDNQEELASVEGSQGRLRGTETVSPVLPCATGASTDLKLKGYGIVERDDIVVVVFVSPVGCLGFNTAAFVIQIKVEGDARVVAADDVLGGA